MNKAIVSCKQIKEAYSTFKKHYLTMNNSVPFTSKQIPWYWKEANTKSYPDQPS